MSHMHATLRVLTGCAIIGAAGVAAADFVPGREVAIERHLIDGEEHRVPIGDLVAHGGRLFNANWTVQEGGGRPLTKGSGAPLGDPSAPLLFPRNFNRVSAPDANSCAGCHNMPFSGGGADIAGSVFVLAQRFDFATFDRADNRPIRGAVDELGRPVTLDDIGNNRASIGMFGSGYIELLAREMTADLQALRDSLDPGDSVALLTKGVDFGELARDWDGTWDVSGVEGLPWPSIVSTSPESPPNLIVRPFHQAGAVVSLRQFTNNAMNHHHGIQPTERFGVGTDPDGDGFVNEMTVADVTAASVWQATLPVPGRIIPRDRQIEAAVWRGEQLFARIGCADCHIAELPLNDSGFVEPNPYNPAGNLRPGDARAFRVDLNSNQLPLPRLSSHRGVTMVPAYTDLKLWDITSGPDDPNREPLDMQHPGGSPGFFAGNSKFLTKKLWGAANEPPYFHHGKFVTLREAIEAHAGAAQYTTDAFEALSTYDQGSIVEFIKTLQVLPAGTRHLIVDERGNNRPWPPRGNGRDDDRDDRHDEDRDDRHDEDRNRGRN